MGRNDRTLEQVLRGTADRSIDFRDLRRLLLWLGFQERIRGDHPIFTKDGVEEILDLQPRGAQAKPYQVRQVRDVIVRYKLVSTGGGQSSGRLLPLAAQDGPDRGCGRHVLTRRPIVLDFGTMAERPEKVRNHGTHPGTRF